MPAPIELSEIIHAPVQRVYAIATDIEGSPGVFTEIVRVEMVSGPNPAAVGTTWRETRMAMGKEASVVLTVTGMTPGKDFTVGCEAMGCAFSTRFEFAEEGAGTRVRMRTTITPRGLMARLMGGMMRSGMAKGLKSDLASLKKAAEGTR